jgi:hypothetical protein
MSETSKAAYVQAECADGHTMFLKAECYQCERVKMEKVYKDMVDLLTALTLEKQGAAGKIKEVSF